MVSPARRTSRAVRPSSVRYRITSPRSSGSILVLVFHPPGLVPECVLYTASLVRRPVRVSQSERYLKFPPSDYTHGTVSPDDNAMASAGTATPHEEASPRLSCARISGAELRRPGRVSGY